ncbi:MAG: FHA domain-containing protein [Pirellulales bacterium]|nr:FHA domain-containing protein [Pirellulales bacterium]
MPTVTIQIIDGAERGRVYENIPLPVTVGREEGNSIQLNDERVSRFHLKIQEDHDQVVLTDLDSTNGTKVNGEDIRLRILRHGDLIAVGRSVMVFGSREQIATRLRQLRGSLDERTLSPEEEQGEVNGHSLDFELSWSEHAQSTLHTLVPPELPARLSPGQAAQLSELIEYLHIRIRLLIETVQVDEDAETVQLDQRQWQGLVELQSRLASYLRTIGEPGA